MTIHQPSWNIFCRLDRVILLARGGVYFDGLPRDTTPWFESLGYTVPEGTNPADYFISIAENFERTDEGARRVEQLVARWRERTTAKAVNGNVNSEGTLVGSESQSKSVKGMRRKRQSQPFKHNWPTPWVFEFQVLLRRAFLDLVSALCPSVCIGWGVGTELTRTDPRYPNDDRRWRSDLVHPHHHW
jgi:hypothetical protein